MNQGALEELWHFFLRVILGWSECPKSVIDILPIFAKICPFTHWTLVRFIEPHRVAQEKKVIQSAYDGSFYVNLTGLSLWSNILGVSARVFWMKWTFKLIDRAKQIALPMWVSLIQSAEGQRRMKRQRKGRFPLSAWSLSARTSVFAGLQVVLTMEPTHQLSWFPGFQSQIRLYLWLSRVSNLSTDDLGTQSL